MADYETMRSKPHIEVYEDYTLLLDDDHAVKTVWYEGNQVEEVRVRFEQIRSALEQGFLDERIEEARSPEKLARLVVGLSEETRTRLEQIVGSITSQYGRAFVEILILQLVIKAIAPEQDIRLHKGSPRASGFSWRHGISMRTLDNRYIVPSLRKHDLLKLNQYGAFMTRTFAENYPYTRFYKAEIRGSKQQSVNIREAKVKDQWLVLVNDLENGQVEANAALLYVLDLLWKSSAAFQRLVDQQIVNLNIWLAQSEQTTRSEATTYIGRHIQNSGSRARLLEIAMHSLLQALEDLGVNLGGQLKPLMPMRTANLKHGNLGDIEVVDGDTIVAAWDAKYMTPYPLDSIDELQSKLSGHDVSDLEFAFVLFPSTEILTEVYEKAQILSESYGMTVNVMTFDEWVTQQYVRGEANGLSGDSIDRAWLQAYVESLALRRKNRAPIDEPTLEWLKSLEYMWQLVAE